MSIGRTLRRAAGSLLNRARVLLRRCQTWRRRRTPWMREIRACQQIIAECDPHPQYLTTYRRGEVYFWLPIPGWLHEDARTRKIERALDIGCGYGTLALFAKRTLGCEVYCADCTDTYISKSLIAGHKLNFAVSNIEVEWPPWPGPFDAILLTEVLEHFNFNPVPTLEKIRKLFAPGGRLYLSTPDAEAWGKVTRYVARWQDLPKAPDTPPGEFIDDHVYQYARDELLEVVTSAGFRVVRLDTSPGLPKRHLVATLEAAS